MQSFYHHECMSYNYFIHCSSSFMGPKKPIYPWTLQLIFRETQASTVVLCKGAM